MSYLFDTFFGPLNKGSCIYFFILSVIFFCILILLLFSEFFFILNNFGKLNIKLILHSILILSNMFIVYFVNRLLYTMCTKSLV